MGTIRALLAIAVVLSHTHSEFVFIKAPIAVAMFYVSSGFLISFIINTNKNYSSNFVTFYINRILRIYPIYFVVLFASLGGFFVFPNIFGPPAIAVFTIGVDAKIYISISSIILFGQDWAYFIGLQNGHLIIQPQFWLPSPRLIDFFVIPQAWTLGVEVTFYVFAPFILINRGVLWLFFLVSGSLKIWSLQNDMGDPWLYRFFPFELSLFLLGAISHRYLSPLYAALRKPFSNSDIVVSAIVIAATLGYRFTSLPTASDRWESLVCATALALVLPALFAFQTRFKVDRAIGELSYPIYINHWLMIPLGAYILDQMQVAGTQQNSAFITALSLLFAVLLNLVVSGPIEHIRRRIRNGAELPAPPPNSEHHDNMPRDAIPDLASPQSRV